MPLSPRVPSARQQELLEHAYRYALDHGLAEMSLRPLASAIDSSPRVLLYLFGSKEGLIRAVLARARRDELAFLGQVGQGQAVGDLAATVRTTWLWLADEAHRPLLMLWAEAYVRSLVEPEGPWSDYARQTVDDWLELLADRQLPARRRSANGLAERTLALSVLRGFLLDLLATGDTPRISAALEHYLSGENVRRTR